ncbi:MAG: vWA domain-containing protein [Cytophagaceae bacterium]
MNWYRTLGNLELLFIYCFALFYLFYITRMSLIAWRMKTGVGRIFIKFILRSAYFTLFIVALLGPSFGDVKKEIRVVGKDIFIAVDLSESMNASDITPTRLEKVKHQLITFLQSFSSDRIGLIIFTSDAFIQCPLTSDHSALNEFVETLNTGLISNQGTDFAPALELALEKHLSEKTPGNPNHNNAKIIILISDGENFGRRAIQAAEKIAANKIRLFTLGVGTEKGSRIPLTPGGYKKDKQNQPVITVLNPEPLKQLAEIADGNYFEINENIDESEHLINKVNSVEGVVTDIRKIDAAANKYFYFLLIALFLIVIDVMITVRIIQL